MLKIAAPIRAADSGPTVSNLQDALSVLLDRQVIRALAAPNRPTADELAKLDVHLKEERARSTFGEATQQFVRYFQVQQGLGDGLGGMVEERTAAKLNEALRAIGAFDERPLVVRGTVTGSAGGAVTGATVRAYDRDMRREELLGEKTTGTDGTYRIPYSTQAFKNAEKGSADLRVCVVGNDGQELVSSAVLFNAPDEAVIDLVVPVSAQTEFQRLFNAVRPLLKGQGNPDLSLIELTPADIAFAARDTGEDEEQIRLLVAAARLSVESRGVARAAVAAIPGVAGTAELPTEVVYGLLQRGGTESLAELLSRPTDELIGGLERAARGRTIPGTFGEPAFLAAMRAQLDALKLQQQLKPSGPDRRPSLGDLLDAVGRGRLVEGVRLAVAGAALEHPISSQEFAGALRDAGVAPADVERIQHVHALDAIAGGHMPAIEALLKRTGDASGEAAFRKLGELGRSDWLQLADELAPPGVAPERYARQLERGVEDAAPTAVLRARVEVGRFLPRRPGFEKLKAFLEQHPAFDVLASNLDSYFEEYHLDGPEALVARNVLRQVQWTKRIGASWDEAQVLIEAGLGHIDRLASQGVEGLKRRLDGKIEERRLGEIGARAQQLRGLGIGLMSHLWPVLHPVESPVMETRSAKQKDGPVGNAIAKSATLRNLFGALDSCACDPNRSVLSPAAYLADLLTFLETGEGALSEFTRRRPDVLDLLLPGKNWTELPQIDLTNEILENAIALPMDIRLPPGRTAEQELSKDPLDGPVLGALRSTVLDPDGLFALKAERDPSPDPLEYGVQAWVVADEARRWSLEEVGEYLGAEPLNDEDATSMTPAERRRTQESLELEQYRADPKLMDMLRRAVGARALPLEIIDVKRVTAGRARDRRTWELAVKAEGAIDYLPAELPVDPGMVGLLARLKLSAGAEVAWVTGPSVPGLQKALGASETLPRSLMERYVYPSELKVRLRPAVEGRRWIYTAEVTITIVYRSAGLRLAGLSYQTTRTAKELAAQAEHRNPVAYDTYLASGAKFPWTLPFDLTLTEVRALLQRAGVPRLELLETARPEEVRYTDPVILQERLGLSAGEYVELTAVHAGADVWSSWGLRVDGGVARLMDSYADEPVEGTPANVLRRASLVMQQARLTLDQLRDLLQSRYVNPDDAKLTPPDTCEPSRLRLDLADDAKLEALLERLRRFVRLQRRLGWSVRELDVALRTIADPGPAPTTPEEQLKRLAGVRLLAELLGQPVELVCAWFGEFDKPDSAQRPTLYEQLFQNRSIHDPPDPALSYDEAAAGATDIVASATTLAALLGVPLTDLPGTLRDLWKGGKPDIEPAALAAGEKLSIPALREMLRNATLARALGWKIPAYRALRRLHEGSDPKRSPFGSPAAMLSLVDRSEELKRAGADPELLEYVLAGVEPAGGAPWVLTDEQVRDALLDVQAGLREFLQGPARSTSPGEQPTPPPMTSAQEKRLERPGDPERAARWGDTLVFDGVGNVLWRKKPGDAGQQKIPLSVLVSRAGVDEAMLEQAMATEWVVPAGDALVDLVADAESRRCASGLDSDRLGRLDQLLGLADITGLGPAELDLALRAFPEGVDVNGSVLPLLRSGASSAGPLPIVRRLAEQLRQPLDVVLSWWGGVGGTLYLKRTGTEGVFERLAGRVDGLKLAPERGALAVAYTIPATPVALSRLATALGLPPLDLPLALGLAGREPGEVIDLVKLGTLHRVVTTAQGLALPLGELAHLVALEARAGNANLLLDGEPGDLLAFAGRALVLGPEAGVVAGRLSRQLGIDAQLVSDLLWEKLGPAADPAMNRFLSAEAESLATDSRVANAAEARALPQGVIVEKLHRWKLLNAAWKLTRAELRWLRPEPPHRFAGLEVDALPVTPVADAEFLAWRRTNALVSLARRSAGMGRAVGVLAAALAAAPAPDDRFEGLAKALTLLLDLPIDDVKALGGANLLNFGTAPPTTVSDDASDPLRLVPWIDSARLLKRLHVSAGDLEPLVAGAPGAEARTAAVAAMRGRVGEAGWLDALREANGKLRIEQRDRLVDYLVARDGLRGPDDLYERYLIDVSMAPCMKTTRLLADIQAVQLFVQRCKMNLEPGIGAGLDADGQWEWMSSYRVWEANRKVFLFPENWLHPELRDDKSEQFKALETDLVGDHATLRAADAAARYLGGLVDVSQITLLGLYETAEQHPTLYLVGRSLNPSPQYFWRKGSPAGATLLRWSPWERIDADIAGDHVVPFVLGGELHIAWALLQPLPDGGTGTLKRYDVRMAWTRRSATGWAKRMVSRSPFPGGVEMLANRNEQSIVAVHLAKQQVDEGRGAAFDLLVAQRQEYPSFFSAGMGRPNVAEASPPRPGEPPEGTWAMEVHWRTFVHHPTDATDLLAHDCTRLRLHNITWLGDVNKPNTERGLHAGSEQSGQHSDSRLVWGVVGSLPNIWFSVDAVVGQENLSAVTAVVSLDDPGPNQTVVVNIDFLVESARDPSTSNTDEWAPLKMRQVGQLLMFGNRDAEWSPVANGYLAAPPDGTLAYAGGYRERAATTVGIANAFPASYGAAQFQAREAEACPSQGGGQGSVHYWSIEEETSKVIVQRRKAGAPLAFAAGYQEAVHYKEKLASGAGNLFDPRIQSFPLNLEFGRGRLHSDYGLVDVATLLGQRGGAAFDLCLPNAIYNWELFLHVPLAIARQLSTQQRFEEARVWLEYVFDPSGPGPGAGRGRFWRCLPLQVWNEPTTVGDLLSALTLPVPQQGVLTAAQSQVAAWLEHPFAPFAVARERTSAFQWYAVMAYIGNLIEWGDSLFRRDTRESIAEATALYAIACKILGRRPEVSAATAAVPSASYRDLRRATSTAASPTTPWSSLAYVTLKHNTATDNFGDTPRTNGQVNALASAFSLHFCAPRNDTLDDLWNRVEDRLFKVRHCMNIEGVTRELPLLDPPIDPELLIRARLAGLDLAEVLGDRYAPAPLYRFQVLLQKALEFSGEVKGLGAALLSALEKRDGERLALLRSQHELAMLGLVRLSKQAQIEEAAQNVASLRQTRQNAFDRFRYLQRMLGENEVRLDGSRVPVLPQSGTLQVGSTSLPEGFAGLGLIEAEATQVWKNQAAHAWSQAASATKTSAAAIQLAVSYSYVADKLGWAAKPLKALAEWGSITGDAFALVASEEDFLSRSAGMIASFQRRREEWIQQSVATVGEIKQIDRQIAAAELRKDIAEKDLNNHDRQMENTREVDDFLRQKFTGAELYTWMQSQLGALHSTAYKLAYDLAKRAERAYRRELGDEKASFISFGYWDSMKQGLLAGEKLTADLRRMEAAYLSENRRELEITKHISLLRLAPEALLALRHEGRCEFEVPEELYDLDFPGHYFRRIKSVSVTIPCVTGQYTGVSAALTLLSSRVRTKSTFSGKYEDQANLEVAFGEVQSVATSSGQNDAGLFELNFRDERFLPFEGSGAVCRLRLELSAAVRQFDYRTITDAIIHMRYTARADGVLAEAARAQVRGLVANGTSQQQGRLLSIRHDFPTEWARFQAAAPDADARFALDLHIRPEHFPYWAGSDVTILAGTLYAVGTAKDLRVAAGDGEGSPLATSTKDGPLQRNALPDEFLPRAAEKAGWDLGWKVSSKELDDLWIVLGWKAG